MKSTRQQFKAINPIPLGTEDNVAITLVLDPVYNDQGHPIVVTGIEYALRFEEVTGD